jgi:hypothetical protein
MTAIRLRVPFAAVESSVFEFAVIETAAIEAAAIA